MCLTFLHFHVFEAQHLENNSIEIVFYDVQLGTKNVGNNSDLPFHVKCCKKCFTTNPQTWNELHVPKQTFTNLYIQYSHCSMVFSF